MSLFKDRLKRIMDDKNLTQAELSAKSGLSKSNISQYVNGVNVPTGERLKKLADALEVHEDELKYDMALKEEQEKCSSKLTVKRASELMHVSQQFIRIGIRRGILPIGYAVDVGSKGEYTYYISPKLFTEVTGIPV